MQFEGQSVRVSHKTIWQTIELIVIGKPDRGRVFKARGAELDPFREQTLLARGT